jgi:hypothetical protein
MPSAYDVVDAGGVSSCVAMIRAKVPTCQVRCWCASYLQAQGWICATSLLGAYISVGSFVWERKASWEHNRRTGLTPYRCGTTSYSQDPYPEWVAGTTRLAWHSNLALLGRYRWRSKAGTKKMYSYLVYVISLPGSLRRVCLWPTNTQTPGINTSNQRAAECARFNCFSLA